MNSGSVIERNSTDEKFAFSSQFTFPQFSFLLPEAAGTLPKHQVANGVVDAFMHVMEQYMTYPANAPLQDRFSESILQTLIELGPTVVENPADYNAMSNLMWCATMALNGLIGCGVPQDWAVHMMGHELTVLYNIDHGRTLAIIAPSHYRYNLEIKKIKLAQFGQRVWGLTTGTETEKALSAIDKMEAFFNSLGIATRLSEYTTDYPKAANYVSGNFEKRGWIKMGERKQLSPSDIQKIVEMSY
jgi:NADP-dependent alcohol dehydrogenase